MLEELGIYIKLAVDVKRQILAGGGRRHYVCGFCLKMGVCRLVFGAVIGVQCVVKLHMNQLSISVLE